MKHRLRCCRLSRRCRRVFRRASRRALRARRSASTCPANGRRGFTRISPNAFPAPTSATTWACRSTTRRGCTATAGTRRSSRCPSISASRIRPTTRRAAPRTCASGARFDHDIAAARRLSHAHLVAAAGAHDLDGRPPASARIRRAHLAGFLDRQVGRRHADGHDHAPEDGMDSPQRHPAQRQGACSPSTSCVTATI